MMELFGLDRAELCSLCEKLGHSAFRGRQIAGWLYEQNVRSIAEMTNLPVKLREQLSQTCTLTHTKIARQSASSDGTSKYLIKLADGETIESVLLPYPDRLSVCISTQVGCPAGCLFCASADCGFIRNLSAGEIVDQVLTMQKQAGQRVTHVVLMGMGEPLLNYNNVVKAIRFLNDEVGISMRRITLSTVGITPSILELAKLELQITLAISLHAPDGELRNALMPLTSRYPLNELLEACREYANSTSRRLTFEYLLIAGINDSSQQAQALAGLLKGMLGHVNLIPYNEVPGKTYKKPGTASIRKFREILEGYGIEVTQRFERGLDVSAACGQLRRSAEGK